MTKVGETISMTLPTRHARRWLVFSLRTLLLLVTVLGIWLGVKVDQARRQKAAVEKLRALGAEIWYDHQRKDDGGFDTTIALDVPGWARELCGEDFFQTVTGIFLLRGARLNDDGQPLRAITDEDLKCLADLPHLEQLIINKAPITDAGLAHLRHPERLRVISLDLTDVGDSFVRRLKGAVRLEALGLERTKVTDDSLAELTNLTNLQVLRLRGTDTGDRALAPFAQCALIALGPGCKTTNAGLRQMRSLARIVDFQTANCQITGDAFLGYRLPTAIVVRLTNCAIGDNDVASLVEAVRDVRSLSLNGCPLTDRGIQHLKQLGKTRTLDLRGTQVTADGVQQLQRAILGLRVLWDESPLPLSAQP